MSNKSESGSDPQRSGRSGSGKIKIRILKNADPEFKNEYLHGSRSESELILIILLIKLIFLLENN